MSSQMDRDMKHFARFTMGIIFAVAIFGLAFLGVIIWAIVALVQHFL